ncbi:MAG: hypothetical protein H7Y30_17765 [Pyrinomonadaceae bacterium]|nr:hypothetical protein [Pyrinomonadaceae bacterium]
MKIRMIKLLAFALAALAGIGAACGGAKSGDQSTPTLAYKALYEAVKRKDTEGIKKALSKGTIEMMEGAAAMQKKPFNQVIENGITETTFAAKLPEMRNEKIWGDVALLEVKNEKTGKWDPLPFAKEDGQWKLAIDTFFKGTMSPQGPANMQNPGQLPSPAPGASSQPPGRQQPGALNPSTAPAAPMPGQPGAAQPPQQPPTMVPPASNSNAKPEPKKDIKPPTR